MADVFGATLSIKDNVSGVLKNARDSATGFRGDVEKAKKELAKLDKQKVKEKEIKLRNTKAYQAIEGVKKKLEPLSKKVVNIKAKTEIAKDKIKSVKQSLDKIKDSKVVNMSVKGAAAIGKTLGTLAVAGAAAGLLAVGTAAVTATKQAVEFQSEMKNVGTLLGGNVNARLAEMSTDVKKMSIDTGVATSDLTAGLYQVVSAFGDSADASGQLEIAAKAAKAGNATTEESINMLSAVTKGYGDTSAAAMQKASDLAFQTVVLGQTTFPELAASMGGAIAAASALGVSQEELFGSMATLTGVTGNTAEVSTQLEGVLASFLSPSADMAKALKKLGYESGKAALESDGLQGVLGKLMDSVDGNQIDLANLFSEKTAKTAVLSLMGDSADAWKEKCNAMADATGVTDQAFQTQQSSVKAMAEKVKNAGSVMLTSIGEKALPYITTALEKVIDKLPEIEERFDHIAQFVGPIIEKVGGTLSNLWIEWQPILQQIGSEFQAAFASAQPCIDGMLTSFSSILPCVQPIVTTLASVIAAAIPAIAPIFEGISSVVADVFPVIAQIVQDVGAKLTTVFGGISSHAGGLKSIIASVGPAISTTLSVAWSIISPILDIALSVIGLLASAIEWAFPYIQGIIEGVWSYLKPVFDGIATGIGWVASAVDKVTGALSGENGRLASNPNVQSNATGTSYYSGGWTTVGEHGPELMNLPSGTKIQSNSSSVAAVNKSGSNININIDHMEVRSDKDIDEIAEKLAEKLEETEDNM